MNFGRNSAKPAKALAPFVLVNVLSLQFEKIDTLVSEHHDKIHSAPCYVLLCPVMSCYGIQLPETNTQKIIRLEK